jgi:Zn-dependent peptidase ImmA (M78 family)
MPSVNHEILEWARITAGLELAEAAKKLSLKDTGNESGSEKLLAYEKGARAPSRSLLLRMSKQYRRPLLTFYMPALPIIADRGEDFRTLQHAVDPAQNSLVDALVRNIRTRQDIVHEALLSEGEQLALDFVESYSIDQGVDGLAQKIVGAAGIVLDEYRAAKTQEKAFKYLREKIEGLGVFTLLAGNLGSHHTNLSTDVFRGFAVADEIAPFVVINDQDAKTAWPVTLLHEVAHLWLGATGISGKNAEKKVEQFCDQVASQILLPKEELENKFDFRRLGSLDTAIVAIDEFAAERKISSSLVAFRLLASGRIAQFTYSAVCKYFYQRWEEVKENQKKKNQAASGGPSYYTLKRLRTGDALLNTSERLMRSGELSTTQVATVLGVRALKVGSLLDQRMAV